MGKTQKIKFIISFVFTAVVSVVLPTIANAATLSFSPSSGSYAVGNTFSASILISSADQSMNAASGAVSFPPDKLEVASVSKTGSVFTLWVQEPSFSNSAGTINFEGIVLNPGFMGATGKAITINFKVKAAGAAVLNFSSGSALANDGKGTNILASLGTANYNLGAEKSGASKIIAPTETAKTLSAPEITSSTHTDPNKWYPLSNAKFDWSFPSGATGARLLVGKIPQAIPTVSYTNQISSKEVEDLTDGIWYFHVRLRDGNGWSGVSHFRFQIDTQPPEPFKIKFVDGNETDNPRPVALFDTTDSLSGIDYYKVKIGEGDFFSVAPEIVKKNPYTLPIQTPGKRNILVQAFDKAGNYTTATEEFIIKPLQAPIITEYPKQLPSGESLVVKGTTKYPDARTTVWFKRGNEEAKSQVVKNDDKGNFTLVAEVKPEDGIYKLWAETIDNRGAQSAPSERVTVSVERPAFLKIGSFAVSLLAVIVPLVAIIILLLLVAWYGWRKFSILRKKLKKEVREAESALHKAFGLLKENVREQIKMLEKTRAKRHLTEEEEKIVKQLRRDLEDAEEVIEKEIEDIEREIK